MGFCSGSGSPLESGDGTRVAIVDGLAHYGYGRVGTGAGSGSGTEGNGSEPSGTADDKRKKVRGRPEQPAK